MDLDRLAVQVACCDAIELIQNGITSEHLEDDKAREVFEYLSREVGEGRFVTTSELELKLGYKVDIISDVSTEFVIRELKNRRLHGIIKNGIFTTANILESPIFDPELAVSSLYDLLLELHEHDKSNIVNLLSYGPKVLELYKKVKDGGLLGIPTPWPTLNESTQGMQEQDFWVIVARMGIGKTFTLLHMMIHAWKNGYKPLLVLTEMGGLRIAQRYYSIFLKLHYDKFRFGMLDTEEEEKLIEGINSIEGYIPVLGSELKVSLGAINAAILMVKPDVVFIDGLYLTERKKGTDRYVGVSDAADECKRLAKKYNIRIVGSTQLNRSTDDDPNKVTDKNIALTDVIGWDADVIYALLRTKDMVVDNEMLFKKLKIREGAGKDFMVNWRFDDMDFDEMNMPNIEDLKEIKAKVNPNQYEDNLII